MAIMHAKQTVIAGITLKEGIEYVIPDVDKFNEVICDALAATFSESGYYTIDEVPDDKVLTDEYEYEYWINYPVDVYGTYYYSPATWWEPEESTFDSDYKNVVSKTTDRDKQYFSDYIAKYYPDFIDKINYINLTVLDLDESDAEIDDSPDGDW